MQDSDSSPPGGADDPTDELRSDARQRTLRTGRIVINRGASTFDVTIRDMSATGARLLLKDAWNLPETFELRIRNPVSGGWTRQACDKRWQRGNLVGARFTNVSG
ncbi:PilZ domain-containing protein [Hyphomonas sp.]|uniref:PilZ domain-containing protein n=1 Tax=Hyphomonas sp. TaxID=87 RepID=UPI0032EB1499